MYIYLTTQFDTIVNKLYELCCMQRMKRTDSLGDREVSVSALLLLCVCVPDLCDLCFSSFAEPCLQWWLWAPTSSATRSQVWLRARGPSARAGQTLSSWWAKAPRWASMSVSTNSATAAGTALRWAKGRSLARSCE